MAASKKKRATEEAMDDVSHSNTDDNTGQDGEELADCGETVQVEFEARNPEDHDFHGIRKLLQQLFLKAHVDLSELTDIIISQNYVGSVIKQAELMGDEEEEDDDDDVAETFGIVTVVNITERKAVECVKQFKSFLLDRSAQSITTEQQSRLKTILDDNGHQVGLLLSERFVNIPPQIALPSYESLVKEMERAIKKGMKYKFAYYVMISKTYKMPQPAAPSGGRRKQNNQTEGRIFVNAEEEFFHEEATLTFDYSVKSERDTAIAGEWDGTADELEPLRTVCVIPGDRMQCIMGKLRDALSLPG